MKFKSSFVPRAPLCLALAAFLSACALPAASQPPAKAMVAAANPMAVEAGLKVLRAGGTAVDAAVAVQATLGLVEPQSSGLGGGSFMTYYDARTKQVTAYNGRETAPMAATPKLFYGDDGKPHSCSEEATGFVGDSLQGLSSSLDLARRGLQEPVLDYESFGSKAGVTKA